MNVGQGVKILHVINTLGTGGAQSVLYTLIDGWGNEADSNLVIALRSDPHPPAWDQLKNTTFLKLNMLPGRLNPQSLVHLYRAIKQFTPDIIQTWLYHADLLGSVIGRAASRAPIYWGVHHTDFGRQMGFFRKAELNSLARLSHWLPESVIYCTRSAMRIHHERDYSISRSMVIPNGVNTTKFVPDETASKRLKRELDIDSDCVLIGCFGRFHPQKDHELLIKAAAILVREDPRVHIVLAGQGIDSSNSVLRKAIKSRQMTDNVHLLGVRHDMPSLIASLDIATLTSSHGEALPVFLLEAMSCGVVCVATDVGDVRSVIGEAGVVIDESRPESVVAGWKSVLSRPLHERLKLGQVARRQVIERYSAKSMISAYRNVYLGR